MTCVECGSSQNIPRDEEYTLSMEQIKTNLMRRSLPAHKIESIAQPNGYRNIKKQEHTDY